MFSIKENDGSFIFPSEETYVGIIELESLNDTYLNIEESLHRITTKEGATILLKGMTDTPIRKSKKLRFETCEFCNYEDAVNTINNYLLSIRIALISKDYKYAPLNPFVESRKSNVNGVGFVMVKLHGEKRINIPEPYVFHNKGGIWYRLLSESGSLISISDVLRVETSAYADTAKAKLDMEAIYHDLQMFLNAAINGEYELSEIGVNIFMAVNNVMSIDFSAKLSKIVRFDDLLKVNDTKDINLNSALKLLEYKGFRDLGNLYKILEIIRADMGIKGKAKQDKKIEALNLSTESFINKFTNTCNNDKIIGLYYARHAGQELNPDNKNAISLDECFDGMKKLIFNWIEHKTNRVFASDL